MGAGGCTVPSSENQGGRGTMTIRFGYQTYTWQMSYELYRSRTDHILDVIAAAQGKGVEPEVCMLGAYTNDSAALREGLERRGLQLGALCLAMPWKASSETAEEREEADRVISYLQSFQGTVLTLVQLPGSDRSDLRQRQQNALTNINAVAVRAQAAGITAAFHPNSPSGSIFRTADDYQVMLEGLDGRFCGYAPDTGHIAKGGMDPEAILRSARSLIRHVHFKDMDTATGQWTALGEGSINHEAITRYLAETGYDGWIMVEEESAAAEQTPDEVTLQNGKYVRSVLEPLVHN
ncbi:sugar phosphate isomerase/epimerase [Paenibacillaceae bacterium]|nr:sugar phosphate isomerase/epimerase [Paenibacillaceae bacterium]